MHLPLAFTQLFFTLSWTVYVIFLPGLLQQAGIDASWLSWILIADQLLFAAADVATGVWLDRSERALHAAGNWLTGLVLLSCAMFVLLPILAPVLPAWAFLLALFVWVMCASVLRVPPLVLLAKHATEQATSLYSPVAAYLVGIGIAGALAPYLTVALKNRDPLLPFVLASVALALTVLVLRHALQNFAASPIGDRPPSSPTPMRFALPLLIAVGLFAIGVQLHVSVNSAKLFARVSPGTPLEWLMPLFWAGFSVAMLPASVWLARAQRATDTLWVAGTVGAFALLACALAPTLPMLSLAQLVSGAAWGVVFLAALTLASEMGASGAEGRWIGATLALIALATVGRIVLVMTLAPTGTSSREQLPWVAGGAWLIAALVFALAMAQRTRHRSV